MWGDRTSPATAFSAFTVSGSRLTAPGRAITALPDGTVIGWPDAVDDSSFFPHFLAVPEEPGAHVVVLDSERLLMAADAPRSADLLADLG